MEEALASNIAAGKGSGKPGFSRSGSIETTGFQGAERPATEEALASWHCFHFIDNKSVIDIF